MRAKLLTKRCDWILLLLLFLTVRSTNTFAQGGPPLLTDDPYTPGAGRWEINIPLTIEKRGTESLYEAPNLDINYGLGERIQLKYEVPWVVLTRERGKTRKGLGNSTIGVKWRFIDEGDYGFAASVYPQLEFNNPTSSVDRGLVDKGTALLIPFEMAKRMGRIEVSTEFGYSFQQYGDDELVYGLVLGYELTGQIVLLAEGHGTARSDFGRNESVLNLGIRWEVSPTFTLLGATGRSFLSGGPDLLLSAGVQLKF